MSNKKSLVSYGSDDEDPPSKRSKTAKIQNSKQSNPDLNDGSQDCIILYETNVREKLKETNDRLIIANKLVKKLQDEVFEHAQKITTLNSVEYKLQQKINILEESNHTLSAQTENERLKVLEISTKYEKLKEDAEKMVEEIEGYKEMAEKYIAKADEEKEAERQRANEAEAKNEELKIQISLLTTTNEMQKFEIIKLQTATATAETLQTCNNNYVQPMVIDKKSRDRIKKEAIRLFETWKINYKNNKNKEIEFQIDHLKKKLKQSEIEKEREIRNGLNNTQKINNLKTERLNLLQTIRKQNCQSFLMAKKSESESTKKIIPGNEKPEKDEGAIEIMKELNIVKENLSMLVSLIFIANNNSSCCSSSASSSQSFSSLSSNLGDDSGAQNYLPAFLANRKPARIGSIDLHFTKLPDGRCLYTYTVDWKENIKEAAAAARQESDFIEMLQHDLVNQLPATISTTTASTSRPSLLRSPSSVAAAAEKKQQKENAQKSLQQLKQMLCAAGVPACNQPQQQQCLRKCDGQLDVHDLTVIGLCEHAACEQCLENAPRIEASFGGLGCPNVKCFLLDMASLCPDKKRRMDTFHRAYMLNSSKSSVSNSPSKTSSTKYTVTMSIETIENPKK